MIGGIGMALMERTLLDPRDGRPVNARIADYLAPANLDVGQLGTSSTRTTRTSIRFPNAPLPIDR
jgi:CO/xanthine dehydrogenase Mo-binding subunit